jgi:hypothetical protein
LAREFTLNRWNFSQEDDKWVYIESKDNGELVYYYQVNPPKQFTELALKIKFLNDKLVACKDPKENYKIFREMMKVSKRMQTMSKIC